MSHKTFSRDQRDRMTRCLAGVARSLDNSFAVSAESESEAIQQLVDILSERVKGFPGLSRVVQGRLCLEVVESLYRENRIHFDVNARIFTFGSKFLESQANISRKLVQTNRINKRKFVNKVVVA